MLLQSELRRGEICGLMYLARAIVLGQNDQIIAFICEANEAFLNKVEDHVGFCGLEEGSEHPWIEDDCYFTIEQQCFSYRSDINRPTERSVVAMAYGYTFQHALDLILTASDSRSHPHMIFERQRDARSLAARALPFVE